MIVRYFRRFNSDVGKLVIPDSLNYPFNYEPHDIAIEAAKELQSYIQKEIEPLHNFGLDGDMDGIGKMFGILVIETSKGELGYIAAFSGKLGGKNDYSGFVPPVYDMLEKTGFYQDGEEKIYEISKEIQVLENEALFLKLNEDLKYSEKKSVEEIQAFKLSNKDSKKDRAKRRFEANEMATSEEKLKLLKSLDRESANLNYALKDLKAKWRLQIEHLIKEIAIHNDKIKSAKERRKKMSIDLQKRLFENYKFLNANGEWKPLLDIFPISNGEAPPSGAGECAAPKLFQYAYLNQLKPIALAEFWYGKSPSSEIRKHGYFYPSCRAKCFPILSHMLEGLKVDPNPLEDNPAKVSKLDIVYDDEYLIVVNKPYDFLSVPGRFQMDSVFTRIQILYPDLKKLMVVHRLDMSTSGLMVFAKTKDVHKNLQSQFIRRTVVKKYIAILDGILEDEEGEVDLPIVADYQNRPRQKVCFKSGKPAKTNFKVLKRDNGKTWIHFYPVAGRTHQLRVHAAHQQGLNIPILGDDLYGKREDRLYLHAEGLRFKHPIFKKEMNFEVKENYKI